MSSEKAEKKWGKEEFVPGKFRKGSEADRAKMVVSLLESKEFIGIGLQEVKLTLGEPDGYFQNDQIPAYFLTRPEKDKKEIWQVVFIPDSDWKKVKEVKIHKNCCD